MQKILVYLLLSHAFLMNRLGRVESKSLLHHLLSPVTSRSGRHGKSRTTSRSRRHVTTGCNLLITSYTGYNLAVDAAGKVYGTHAESDEYARFDRVAVDMGIVLLRHSLTGRYLSINDRGKLVSTDECGEQQYFLEEIAPNGFLYYVAQHHLPWGQWYIGINRNGRPIKNYRFPSKKSARIRQGQKFIVRRAPCRPSWSWSRDR